MIDKNGIEMKTGDIVKVDGAFFNNDNGYYFIAHTPGDPTWCGRDYSLKKIGKRGKISTAKSSIAFWPLKSFCSDKMKNYMADEHNGKNASIEIINDIDRADVVQYFENEANNTAEMANYYCRQWGGKNEEVFRYEGISEFYSGVADRLKEGAKC